MSMPPTSQTNDSRQRIWNDLTYGTLSSDGRCVYSIEDNAAGGGLRSSAVVSGARH